MVIEQKCTEFMALKSTFSLLFLWVHLHYHCHYKFVQHVWLKIGILLHILCCISRLTNASVVFWNFTRASTSKQKQMDDVAVLGFLAQQTMNE
jgi:hypothetical protein